MSESLENRGFIARSMTWINERFPWTPTMEKHASKYYAPKNFNVWYVFGVLAFVVLIIQLVTGLFLTMNFVPTAEGAFGSIEYAMHEVDLGWLIRYAHSTGASAFFVVIYLHMFRGFAYGSYRKPRELIWLIGMGIYLVLMAEGFFGYLLPWGNMSYWGAQVIVSLVGAVPIVGADLAEWVRGDFVLSGITLNRFFALHVFALPGVLVVLVFVHMVALHHVGSNNPDGIEIKEKKDEKGVPLDGIPFHPYYTVHDFFAVMVFLILFCAVMFFAPEMFGYFIEKPNFEIANPIATPDHIAPVWYYTPFYAMLRAVTFPLFGLDAKFWGLVVMAGAILIPVALPWLDKSPVKSIRYKGRISKFMLGMLVISFIVLGYLGTIPPSGFGTATAQIATLVYFSYFLLMPWYTRREKTKPVPERVTGGH